ncbi:hypothetical protein [Limobrevibacterium gyesilva]|uniref:DUF3137 domain-containing protein n=1 Tax=Limobrevibacterium gyesilva TaxID=2991712 RepID=A0AA42CJZ1_9PROT|nr:hypothetical protein [Limobrevibacterium gyesilva]MCW3477335.1 hypothetical protein [Limobrevibacterium gyesilva]
MTDAGGSLAGLRELYDRELAAWLAAEDARAAAGRRNRWLVLAGGLGLAAAVLAYAWRSTGNNIPVLAAVLLGAATLLIVRVMAHRPPDAARRRMLEVLARFLGFTYARDGAAFPLAPFAILGLAGCNDKQLEDRLTGRAEGLAFDLAAGVLAERPAGAPASARPRVRLDGIVMRFTDPTPSARFRLLPHIASRTAAGTGDDTFDTVFTLEADNLATAQRRLDPATRRAMLRIAGLIEGATVSIGFDRGEVLLAFATHRRFDIGPPRPPLTQFQRFESLANQITIVFEIASLLRTAARGA